jgi:predicted nucleic acid-binding protein
MILLPNTPGLNKPLWVLDTNVVLDIFHFDDAATRPLARALEAGLIRCAASPATLAEWRRVLAYPEFGLDAAAQTAMDARYTACVTLTADPDERADLPHKGTPIHYGLKPVWSRMPRCRDADDQKFLELAAACSAEALVSKDRALLDLCRRRLPFAILSPQQAAARCLARVDISTPLETLSRATI